MQLRAEEERHDTMSGFTNKVRGRGERARGAALHAQPWRRRHLCSVRLIARPRLSSFPFRHTHTHDAQLAELEASVADPTGTHSLAYSCALRNVVPLAHPTEAFRTAASPECVTESC